MLRDRGATTAMRRNLIRLFALVNFRAYCRYIVTPLTALVNSDVLRHIVPRNVCFTLRNRYKSMFEWLACDSLYVVCRLINQQENQNTLIY